ncbi:MAG: hypothetical protein RJB26_454, partial [Pseudomonadota bacterium]
MDQKSRRGSRRRGDRFPDTELMRLPPHSIEAEQAVLGALLLDAQAWDAVADVVTSEDFYRRDHQLIFAGLAGVVETRGPCDAVTVAEFLERKGQLEEAGGLAYIATLARDTPSSANVRVYADIVRERAVLRALVSAGSEIAGSALEASGRTAAELVDEAERAVFAIAEKGAKGRAGFQSVKDVLPGT